jgi:hypothetical protein
MGALEGLMLRLHYVGIALFAATGCSPVKDNSNVPDASIDATDMRPPMVESSVPANMGTKVNVIAPISVFFDEAIDPARVNATTVKLAYLPSMQPFLLNGNPYDRSGAVRTDGLVPLKGTVSYDEGAKKVSFVPSAPLPYGVQCTLTYDVVDHAGLAAKGSLSFTTYVNNATKQYTFNGTNNAPSGWVGFPSDMNGRPGKRLSGSSPGSDTIWFSPDDPKNSRQDFGFTLEGRLNEERTFGTGGDSVYDTADDPTTSCVTYKYDASTLLVSRYYGSSIGPDAMWCTNDDVPAYYWTYQYNSSTASGFVWYTARGADNTWRTTDDLCSAYIDYEYDSAGNKLREILKGCGSDSLPRNTDDSYAQYWEYEYDGNGYVTRVQLRVGPGLDAMWLTADDPIIEVRRFTRDADGQVTDSYISSGAGADGVWGNQDDTGTRTLNVYNAMKLPEETTSFNGLGGDGMWGTPDDVIANYTKTTYDVNGNRIDQKMYNAGQDAMWKNADDRIITDYDFDLTK